VTVSSAINSIEAGFAAVAARAVIGVSANGQHLPLPLHLLPYPGCGPAGLALNTDAGVF
jgi:hypothetical protein